ncbi:MAG: hypothetical protein JO281_20920 [Pseudonocardiales bacterium]|nr:hypothetical protein [Pseudonocardiales bacterium]
MAVAEGLVSVRRIPGISRGVRPAAVCGVAGAVAGGLLFLVAHRGFSDDAYITLDYARNLAFHGHWGVVPSLTANTATSPLNVGLLAAITAVVREPVLAVGLLLMATTAASAVWLLRIAEITGLSRRLLPTLGVGLLLSSPLLASTVGLETYLCAALFIGLVRYALAGRWLATGIVGGLLILGRPDLAVVDVVVVLTGAAARRRALRSGLVAVVVAAPWYLLSWSVLGSVLPDTFFLKTHDVHGWVGFHFASGPLWYLRVLPLASALTLLAAGCGLVSMVSWAVLAVRHRGVVSTDAGQAAVAFGLGGIGHAVVFASLGTPPSHWYYGPVLTGLSLCSVLTALIVVRTDRAISPRGVVALGSVSLVILAAAGYDIARGVPWESAPIYTNWATRAEYQRIAEDISRMTPGATVVSPSEVGTLAYFCNCELVDFISDPGRTEQDIAHHMQQSGPLMRQLLKLNYIHHVPASPKPAEFAFVWEKTCVNAIGEWRTPHWSNNLCLKNVAS